LRGDRRLGLRGLCLAPWRVIAVGFRRLDLGGRFASDQAGGPGSLDPMGGDGSIIEIDETFIGHKEGAEIRRGYAHKNAVLSLVERGGEVRSFQGKRLTYRTID
jgi:hypothetical protein